MINKPQILTLNLTDKANQLLIENGFNTYEGSLGKPTKTDVRSVLHGDNVYCLPQYDFPSNIHEFDIIIIDFSNEETVDYIKEKHIRKENKTGNDIYLLCKQPQTVFDPRALSSHILYQKLKEHVRNTVIIVFQSENIRIEYQPINKIRYNHVHDKQNHTLYDFMPSIPFSKNKFGRETKILTQNQDFTTFLDKYNSEFTYENTYYHPCIYQHEDDEKKSPDPSFHPILQNASDEIVSYYKLNDKDSLYVFPVLQGNSEFILEFLQDIAPTFHPSLFPNSTKNKWTSQEAYYLPNHLDLLDEKQSIVTEYEEKIKAKEEAILENINEYNFLHKILTETSDELVKAVIIYLEWLAFDKVIDMDEQGKEIKEEDIQIENEKGLLVIEVKGIGGTSKDSECNQILKIKYRRSKERSKFDVFGLYIVNHQKHLPPKERRNPPFSKEQKEDAFNEERGLLTTWQLFNLYNDIENQVITKEEARESIYKYGLISFAPKNIKLLGTIEEIFLEGSVFILTVIDIELKKGGVLFAEKQNNFQKLTILELKLNDKVVVQVKDGEVGIKVDKKVSKKMNIWIKL